MKKAFLLLCLLATTTIVSATDLWEGNHEVKWDNTLSIVAAKFADAQVGQKIVIEFKDATGEVIELHSNGGMLPGTRYEHRLHADQHEMEVFITKGMLARLKESGLEICGTGFTATKALEVAKTMFDGINWSDYKAIRFYSQANRTNYVINVLTKWGDDGRLGDQGTMTMTNEYAELNIESIDMAAKLAEVDRLMVQCNKEDGEPFNFTAIVLVKKSSTGISAINAEKTTVRSCFDLQGRRVSQPAKGLYIINGKKFIIK